MKTVVFIGHSECYGMSINELENVIVECIKNGATQFLSGGQGGFDRTCASVVFKLKSIYPHINNILVIPYITFNVFNKNIFDEIIFPTDFEKYHYKSAIPQRNKYMVTRSDAAICFVHHSWGNAAKTYELAKKLKLQIINLSNNKTYNS